MKDEAYVFWGCAMVCFYFLAAFAIAVYGVYRMIHG